MTRKPDERTALRAPPYSESAELGVLGACMLDPSALLKVSDWLSDEMFFVRAHRILFRAIVDLAANEKPYDSVTMMEWASANNLADDLRASDILGISNSTPSSANVVAYAEIVASQHKLREAITIGVDVTAEAYKPGADARSIATLAMQRLAELADKGSPGGFRSLREMTRDHFALLHERYERGAAVTGIATPWLDLNDITGGLQDAELIVIAGRPNMGKTVTGLNIATHAAARGNERVLIFSLEQSERALMDRIIASEARVSHRWLVRPEKPETNEARSIDEENWTRTTQAITDLRDVPLLIDDTRALTAAQIVSRARREHLRKPVRLVVVDHLQRVGRPHRPNNDVSELGQITAEFSTLARILNCPVVLLCQLNRGPADRKDPRPTLTDLRASGAIEEDADIVIFLHRDDYYDRKSKRKGILEMILGKGRDVQTGQVAYSAHRFAQMRIDDLDPEHRPSEDDDEPEKPTLAGKGREKKARQSDIHAGEK